MTGEGCDHRFVTQSHPDPLWRCICGMAATRNDWHDGNAGWEKCSHVRCRVRRGGEILLAIQMQGVYDGVAAYLMEDGSIINRFDGPEWPDRLRAKADEWIEGNGPALLARYGFGEERGDVDR